MLVSDPIERLRNTSIEAHFGTSRSRSPATTSQPRLCGSWWLPTSGPSRSGLPNCRTERAETACLTLQQARPPLEGSEAVGPLGIDRNQ
jgi:hypothetical protein